MSKYEGKAKEALSILLHVLPIGVAGLIGYFFTGIITGYKDSLEWIQFVFAVILAAGAWYWFIVRKV